MQVEHLASCTRYTSVCTWGSVTILHNLASEQLPDQRQVGLSAILGSSTSGMASA
jgi:hypothetical protein